MSDAKLHEDTIAEFAALNMAVIKALTAITSLAEGQGVPRDQFLSTILNAGDRDMGKTTFWSIPEDRREAVAENARARFADILAAVNGARGPTAN